MKRLLMTSLTFALLLASPAGAAVPHTVTPGETLWSIAAANNLTTRTVAVYNGLSEDAQVVLGSTIMVPTVAEGAAKLQEAGVYGTPQAGAAPVAATAAAAPAAMGSYVVRAGDSLSGLAAGAGVPMSHLATMNGLDPEQPLLTGTVLKLPSGAPAPANASAPVPAATVVPEAAPNPTPGRVDAGTVQQVAAEHGVPGSLAAAIAWQESGFNNAMVSSANARGVMQIMPGTWDWIQENLAHGPLDPNSPYDNVHAGVMYLQNLLDTTGGDSDTAIAAYYQGLGSVQSRGFFDDTRQYVANVQALRSRFGG